MDKGPDQDTRDDPDGLVEAIAENDSDDLYAPPEQVPEKTVREPHDDAPDNSPDSYQSDRSYVGHLCSGCRQLLTLPVLGASIQ